MTATAVAPPTWCQVANAKVIKFLFKTGERTKKGKEKKVPVRVGYRIDMEDGSYWTLTFAKSSICPKCGRKENTKKWGGKPCPKCGVHLVPKTDSWTQHYPRVAKMNLFGNGPMIEDGKPVLLPEQKASYPSRKRLELAWQNHVWGPTLLAALDSGILLADENEAAAMAERMAA
jgi:hypothetical protein